MTDEGTTDPISLPVDAEEINWRQYIHTDPRIIVGKPVVKGTRLGVELLLRLFAAGWTTEQVMEAYPHLPPEGLRAVFAMAAELVADEMWSPFPDHLR